MKLQKLLETINRLPELGRGPEPMTDELIDELVMVKGLPEADMRFIQKIGGMYLKSQEVFILPTQINYHRLKPHSPSGSKCR